MHRFILGARKGEIVDHRNGDGLDNRRDNLRLCVGKENQGNRRLSKNNKSGYKGVCLDNRRGQWVATIYKNRKPIYLGSFNSAIDAANAYDNAAIGYFGDFALTNAKIASQKHKR